MVEVTFVTCLFCIILVLRISVCFVLLLISNSLTSIVKAQNGICVNIYLVKFLQPPTKFRGGNVLMEWVCLSRGNVKITSDASNLSSSAPPTSDIGPRALASVLVTSVSHH